MERRKHAAQAGRTVNGFTPIAVEVEGARIHGSATVKTSSARVPMKRPFFASFVRSSARGKAIIARGVFAFGLGAASFGQPAAPLTGSVREGPRAGETAAMDKTESPDFGASLRPSPASARFEDPDYYIWCGAPVQADDGSWHLYYSRWPRSLGHAAWVTHSEVAHAVASSALGPWKHSDVTLPARGAAHWDGLCTHNPTVLRADGKYYLYYMGNTGDGKAMASLNWTHRNNQRIGVAVAERPEGPWLRSDVPLIAPTEGFLDSLMAANPSVTRRPDGRYLMVYKGVDRKKPLPFGGPVLHVAAVAERPTGPFRKHPKPVFVKEGVLFAAEDPYIWRGRDRYWAIVKDMKGHFTGAGKSLALFESRDGLDWTLSRHPLVSTTQVRWQPDGRVEQRHSLERPQLAFDREGRPVALLCATDADVKREHSFNVGIPLAEVSPLFFAPAP